jgi:hypothetical protein
MRRIALLTLCTLLLAVASCDGTLIFIEVDQQTTTTVERGTLLDDLVGDLGLDDFLDMDITTSSELQNQGVEPGDISSVELTLFELEVLAPDGGDLSFLSSVELYVEAPDLPEIRVASATDLPEGQPTVVFDLDRVDLTDYVVSRSMTLSTDISGHRPEEDTEVRAHFVLDVGVTTQGACNAIQGS